MYTPSPRKLGHLVLLVRDLRASAKFYEEVVGLTVSDWISDRMVFMRAGSDHHDLALAQLPDSAPDRQKGTPGLEHFSYQVDSYEDIEKTVEMLQARGIEIDRGPGKHGPGENCFIVFKDPDGNNVEFYCEMLQVTEDKPYEASVWNDDINSFDQWQLEKFVVPPPERFKDLDKN
jgi:catechol-2,3-dioxygenase